jgi:adenine C2-methylase RlmN of 23S rRNA A2503 and tRNA A37
MGNNNETRKVCEDLEQEGFDFAVAVATQAEIDAGAACGQLSIITEEVAQ